MTPSAILEGLTKPGKPEGRDQTNDSQPWEEKTSMTKICVGSMALVVEKACMVFSKV